MARLEYYRWIRRYTKGILKVFSKSNKWYIRGRFMVYKIVC